MPVWLGWAAVAWLGSKVLVNTTESIDNTASAGAKAAGAAILGLGAYVIYKKVT